MTTLTGSIEAKEKGRYCTLDESNEEFTSVICRDELSETHHVEKIDPLVVHEMSLYLQENGIEVLSTEDFLAKSLLKSLDMFRKGPEYCLNCEVHLEEVYYRVEQFNRLPTSDPTITRLKALARAMQEANVCNVNVKSENYNNISVSNSDELLHHFLCISNSESVFGRDNIGMGGRGPWGIHPMHNQRSGTKAFVDGKTTTLKSNGLCYPGKAVVRDANGTEIKTNRLYQDPEVIRDNAKCAIKLYQRSGALGGFSAWGKGKSWGSNRHCSKSTRDRLQFMKHLGELGCCSQACKERVRKSI